MGKFILGLVGVYILYYTVNIIYDLFLKKEKVVEDENLQSFAFDEISEPKYEPVRVGIEDVENIQPPQSYETTDDVFLSAEENPSMEELKEKYERENEENYSKEKPKEKSQEELPKIGITDVKKLLADINTRVKMIANYDGQKVYQIQNS